MFRRFVLSSLLFAVLLLSAFLLPVGQVFALTTTPSRTPTTGCGSVVVVTSTPSPTFTPTPRTATATATSCGVIYVTATPTATFTPTADLTVTGHVYTQVYDMMVPVSGAQVQAALNMGRVISATTDTTGAFSMFLPGAYLVGYGATFTVSATNYVSSSTFYDEATLRANAPFLYFALNPTTPIPSLTPTLTGTVTRTPTVTPVSTNNDVPLPDLVISSITYVGSTPACANMPMDHVVITNNGAVAAGTFVVAISKSGTLQSPQTINGLAAGQSVTLSISAAGSVTATADSTNVITESNETNNSLTVSLPVPTQAFTCTPTSVVSLTPTRTPTITVTPSRTPTATVSTGTCSPVSATITAPFAYDGAGSLCWRSSNLGTYINSWNTTSVILNGVNISNLYVAAGSYPAKISGYWYVAYNSSVAWGHFEAK